VISSEAAARELYRREKERRLCRKHPAELLKHMTMPDTRAVAGFGAEDVEDTQGDFKFKLNDPGSGWFWQRDLLDWWLAHPRTMVLKARQLGVTWLACGLGLWLALCRPGSLVLVYRQKEKDAVKIIDRVWDMLHSMPTWLWNGGEVITPAKGSRPSESGIRIKFPSGKVSVIRPMSSAESEGHGDTAALVIMDEFAHIESAGSLMRAVSPAAGKLGKIVIISTANGRADVETGEGNFFHFLWVNDDNGFEKKFLSWRSHPDRDDAWYESSPEVQGLRWWEKMEQYPSTPLEAFASPSAVWFDRDSLRWYAEERVAVPIRRYKFVKANPTHAKIEEAPDGWISEFETPVPGREYAIGADVATGRGTDYSAAYVVDLTSMGLVAEFHAKLDADQFAYQLHFLGKRYNIARIAVERGGGWGDPVIINLRDGKDGRPHYPRQYRYREEAQTDIPERKQYGIPMSQNVRTKVINAMEAAIRERLLPSMPPGLLHECDSFVRHDTGTTPRAMTGTHDDRVMAAAITLELYRIYGHHPDQPGTKRLRRKPYKHWLPLGNDDVRRVAA
jgi:hypothetical protein